MSAAYVTTADIDPVIGSDVRQVLFSTDDTAANYSATYFARINNFASALVQSAAQNAGYSLGDTTTSDFVILATIGMMLLMVMPARRGIKLGDQASALMNLAEGIRTGATPIPDLTASTRSGVGGETFSDNSSTSSTGLPQIFGRNSLLGY